MTTYWDDIVKKLSFMFESVEYRIVPQSTKGVICTSISRQYFLLQSDNRAVCQFNGVINKKYSEGICMTNLT